MKWRDVWTDNAIRGIREVRDFRDNFRPGDGRELVNAIFDRVMDVLSFPESAPAHPRADDPRIRRLVFRKHVIIYRIVEDQCLLEVLAVRHERQSPVDLEDLP